MHYLIDGNNLLFAAQPFGPGAPVARQWLCDALGRWAQPQAAKIVIVFDGPSPGPALHGQMQGAGIEVRFSAPLSADDVIEQLVTEARRPGEIRVVTSDHAVQAAARARRCTCIDSESFAALVFAPPPAPPAQPPPQPAEKPAQPSHDESDAWLRRFGHDPDEPPDVTEMMEY